MKIRILDAATEDLRQGYRFYERQQEGLGGYFLDSLFSDIDSLQIYAGVHPLYVSFHRLLSRRFPFAIEAGIVSVYAVLDCRKKPAWHRKRLG
ncbi:hypothetical protein [Geothermobacter hydrogeniphilus]|uniref:ParE toxin of type II toxin-antitoxin system, parDE n=1 Tax=Geothermobacter hydrogeniphilus TaxID=1969733 RepID=A0A1X0XIY5_9BACT|nr:hypothetical protein [Geothermobacter hydrogeniphilus]ORJ52860.1 hypothetical protein B5V00_16610 [Geothermobacter hydrogeniphilus]